MDVRNFGFLLKDVSRLYIQLFERHAAEIGVTLPQAKVLAYLARNQGVTQARLAELTETDPMTLVRMLDRMETDGWIQRRPDAADRRVRRLHLRPPAGPMLDAIADLAARARAVALANLTAADQEAILRTMEQIHANLSGAEGQELPPLRAAAVARLTPPAKRAPRPRARR